MAYYNRTDISEGINLNKTSTYRYLLNNKFRFQTSVCNGCH